MVTILAARDSRASFTQSSGPMPAGSPEVSAITGGLAPIALAVFEAQLDVGLVAQLAQPLLVGLVGLALAQRLPRLHPYAVGAHVRRAPLEHLDEVVAERRLDR